MKVALTGATGFLGSHVAEALTCAGHELVVLVRSVEKAERVLTRRRVWPVTTVVGDIRDETAIRRLLAGCDAVVHAAAAFYGDEGVLQANVAGVHNTLGIGADIGLDPLIYISTIAAMFPPPGAVITVDDPIVEVKTTYGRSKAEGERIAREMQARGASVVTVYPGAIQGPDDPGPTEGTKGVRDRLRFGWLRTSGGLPLVDVRDVAAIVAAVCAAGRGPRRYMAGGNFLPWMDEADLCEELTGRAVRRVPAPPALVRGIGRGVDFVKWLVPSFDYPLTREAAEFVTQIVPCDSTATVSDLGVEFRPARDTLRDTIRWLYEVGEINAKCAGILASGARG
jgi:nucleoside-diphosphate-sugar epimerase